MITSHLLQKIIYIVINALLIALLANQAAKLVWNLKSPAPRPHSPLAVSPSPEVNLLSLSGLQFKHSQQTVRTKTNNPTIKPSQLGWLLQGVYLEENNESVAIIKTDKGIRSVGINDIVEPTQQAITVTRISDNSVTLNNNGADERLELSTNPITHLEENVLEANIKNNTSNIDFFTIKKPVDLLKVIRFVTVTVDNRPAFRVFNRDNAQFLEKVGLQQGDIILEIEGHTLTPENMKNIFPKIQKSKKFSAKIKRDGTIQHIEIK